MRVCVRQRAYPQDPTTDTTTTNMNEGSVVAAAVRVMIVVTRIVVIHCTIVSFELEVETSDRA